MVVIESDTQTDLYFDPARTSVTSGVYDADFFGSDQHNFFWMDIRDPNSSKTFRIYSMLGHGTEDANTMGNLKFQMEILRNRINQAEINGAWIKVIIPKTGDSAGLKANADNRLFTKFENVYQSSKPLEAEPLEYATIRWFGQLSREINQVTEIKITKSDGSVSTYNPQNGQKTDDKGNVTDLRPADTEAVEKK